MVGFDGCATVAEVLTTLEKLIGLRAHAHSGFLLFTDDPIDTELLHCLRVQEKVRSSSSSVFENGILFTSLSDL